MESSDNKTPRAVSGRPSLLSTPAGAAQDKNSQTRMLASLERDGKMPGPVSAANKPARRKYGMAVLAVALVAGIGAFFAFGPFDDASANIAATSPSRVVAVTAAEHPASIALPAAGSAPLAAPAVSAAAVAHIELAAASVPEAVSATTPVAQAQPPAASQPQVNPLDKLALRDAESPATQVAAAAVPARKDKSHGKVGLGAKVSPGHKARKAEDDADTELVAAIIARLDRRGAKPAAATPVVVTEATPASIGNQVHQCSSNVDLVEARQCRNRACEGHWGKVDACPASRAPKTSRSDGADSGKRG